MEELLISNLIVYTVTAVFTGLWIALIIYGIIKRTKKIENRKIRTFLRFVINGVLICFWIWFFICVNLYPIILACYEYNCDIVEEKSGVIENIEQIGKDRVNIVIDDTEYKIIHSSTNPVVIIGKDIDEGDTVNISFGVKSKYIFDIHR